MATYIIASVIIAAVAAVIFNQIRHKVKGDGGCASGCGGCPRSGLCNPNAQKEYSHSKNK